MTTIYTFENNEILYSVPYQHFTNAIENWFSVLKSKLQKKEGLTYNYLQSNIEKLSILFQIFNKVSILNFQRCDIRICTTNIVNINDTYKYKCATVLSIFSQKTSKRFQYSFS